MSSSLISPRSTGCRPGWRCWGSASGFLFSAVQVRFHDVLLLLGGDNLAFGVVQPDANFASGSTARAAFQLRTQPLAAGRSSLRVNALDFSLARRISFSGNFASLKNVVVAGSPCPDRISIRRNPGVLKIHVLLGESEVGRIEFRLPLLPEGLLPSRPGSSSNLAEKTLALPRHPRRARLL